MRWPWGKRRPDEQLKEQLRERARGDQGWRERMPAPPPPAAPPDHPAPVHQSFRMTPLQPPEEIETPLEVEARRPWTTRDETGVQLATGFTGTDLTLYVRRRGRAVAFKGRPRPVLPKRELGHLGHRLTCHVNRRGRRVTIGAVPSAAGPLPGLGGYLALAVKWLFQLKPKILIIERYMWSETFGMFLLGTMGFTFFMIITSIFSLGEKIFQKNIPPFTIAHVLFLSAPAFVVLAIPVAVVFSTLMAMGRLNRDNEIIALTTNGISLYRIFVPFIAMALLAGVLTWVIYEQIVPPNNQQYKDVLKVFWEAQVVDFIKPGIVIKAPDRKYFYVDRINKTEKMMYGIRLYDYYGRTEDTPRRFPRIFIAEQAWVAGGFLNLRNVTMYNPDEIQGDTMVSAAMPSIKIDIRPRTVDYPLEPHPTELQAQQLRNRIARKRDRVLSLPFYSQNEMTNLLRDWTEYYLKFSIPVACLVLVLVAVPVSLRGPRDERNLGIILTFGLVMAYYIVFFTARTLGARGIVITKPVVLAGHHLLNANTNLFPPYVAGWVTPFVFLVLGLLLIWRARK